jgi:hypothetical protein
MFDSQRYAVFDAVVKIHELGNVPQLEGEFQLKYKFRGKRPKGKDASESTRLVLSSFFPSVC